MPLLDVLGDLGAPCELVLGDGAEHDGIGEQFGPYLRARLRAVLGLPGDP
jgi:hypothetical protein